MSKGNPGHVPGAIADGIVRSSVGLRAGAIRHPRIGAGGVLRDGITEDDIFNAFQELKQKAAGKYPSRRNVSIVLEIEERFTVDRFIIVDIIIARKPSAKNLDKF